MSDTRTTPTCMCAICDPLTIIVFLFCIKVTHTRNTFIYFDIHVYYLYYVYIVIGGGRHSDSVVSATSGMKVHFYCTLNNVYTIPSSSARALMCVCATYIIL